LIGDVEYKGTLLEPKLNRFCATVDTCGIPVKDPTTFAAYPIAAFFRLSAESNRLE
jgi:hypothetical protein